jgi:hypothetical protein
MATLTLRGTKGSALTHSELDGNFTALNTELTATAEAVAQAFTTGSAVATALDTALGSAAWRTSSLTGSQAVALIDTALGGTSWQSGGAGSTDITVSRTSTAVAVNSSSGADASIAAADASNAGVMTAALFTKLNGLPDSAGLATQISDATAPKANLASPTFTGTPAGPTPTAGTNTTQFATTAFVNTAIVGKADIATVTEQVTAATYTLVQADNGKQKIFTNTGAITVTVGAGLTNFGVVLTRGNGAGQITIQGNVSPAVTIRTGSGTGPHVVQTTNVSVTLLPTNTANEYTLAGPVGAGSTVPDIASQSEAEAGTDNTKFMTALRVAQAIDAQAATGGSSLPFGWAVGFMNDFEYTTTNMHGLTQIVLAGGSAGDAFPTTLFTGRSGVSRINGASGQTNSGLIYRAASYRARVGDEHVSIMHFDPTLVVPDGSAGTTNVAGRSGFAANQTAAIPTFGVCFEKTGHAIKGILRSSSPAITGDTANYTVAAAGFYTLRVTFVSTTQVRFRIYLNENTNPVFDETLTDANVSSFFGVEMFPQAGAYSGSVALTGGFTGLANIDLIAWGNPTKYLTRPY